MKTLVKMLGAVAVTALVTACGPDMKTINSASERAETAASGAEDAVRRANDAVSRLEAAFSTSVTK
jgi:hypothetical protein